MEQASSHRLHAAAAAVKGLALLLCLHAAAGQERRKLEIYQSSEACLDERDWAGLSSTSGLDIRLLGVANRGKAASSAAVKSLAARSSPNGSQLLFIQWSANCSARAAAQVTSLPGLLDVSFADQRCQLENLLLSAAVEYLHSVIGKTADGVMAILDACPARDDVTAAINAAYLSRHSHNYADTLSKLLVSRRIAGFRRFIMNWPVNLTEGDFKSILSGGWNETWFLLYEPAGSLTDFLSVNGSAFGRIVLSNWRTRIYKVALESISTTSAMQKLLPVIQPKTDGRETARLALLVANAIVHSGSSFERLATYMPNGTIALESSAAKNLSDSASNQSQVLNIAFVQNPPFTFVSGDGQLQGICVDILNLISPLLNITFVFKQTENSNWDMIISMLANKSADIGSCDLSVTWQRSQVVDFSVPWTQEYNGIAIPVLKHGTDLLKIYQPFDAWAYLVTTLVIILCGSVMAALAWFSPLSLWNLRALYVDFNPSTAYRDEVSVKQNVWTMFSTLLHQGQDFYPNSSASRTLMFFWWMVSLILLSTYTAALVALLTVPEKATVPDSLESLLELGYEFLVPVGSYNMRLFTEAQPGTIFASIRDAGKVKPYVGTYSYDMLAQEGKKVALVSDRIKLTADLKDNCSSLVVTETKFSPSSLGFAFRRDAIWVNQFNSALQLLVEKGLIGQLRSKYWTPNVICKASQPDTLNLSSTAGIFVLFVVFCAIALAALIVELVTQACGWSACSRMLAVSNKNHLDCVLAMVRPSRAKETGRTQRQKTAQQQLPEEFRNVRWRPEPSRVTETNKVERMRRGLPQIVVSDSQDSNCETLA